MTAISTLERSALKSCNARGHNMREFDLWSSYILPNGKYHIVRAAHCKTCGRPVWIDNHPGTNEIEICGEAVAVNCEGLK